jgi:hypothetical protein
MLRFLSGLPKPMVLRQTAFALTTLALAASLASCKNEVEAAPETGTDYYPVKVGSFWVYAVSDTTWSQASFQGVTLTHSVATPSTYQVKETVTETFSDAAGATAYRMVRASRSSASAAWRNDSVFVVSATPQFVAINRSNTRTLELIFPLREGRSWNFNGFNNSTNDTISAETRQYSHIGEPFTTGDARLGIPSVTYAATTTTNNTGKAADNNLLKLSNYQQVFAKGIGPVFRNRRKLLFFNYTNSNGGNQEFPPNNYFIGSGTHRETLIDYGPR